MKHTEAVLILHDIRSKQNVGSMFRTGDAVGITKIYLTGYTPAPIDRFDRPVQEIAKAALGAEKSVPWEKKKDIKVVLKKLKQEGYMIVAIEQSTKSTDYKDIVPKFPLACIVGNEVSGISNSILDLVDVVAEIPMKGKKESLNVSVSAGVALFQFLDR